MFINPFEKNPIYDELSKKIETTFEIVNIAPEGEADISLLEELTLDVVQSVQGKKSIWTTIVSFFYGLVGLVSNYERLQREATELEKLLSTRSDKDSSKLIEFQLNEKRAEIKQVVTELNSEIEVTLSELDKVESHLKGLRKSSENSKLDSQMIVSYMEEASESAQALQEISGLNAKIIANYQDDPALDLSIIKTLNDRLESTNRELDLIRNQLHSHLLGLIPDTPQEKPVELNRPGGILNGGNTCYLASSFQTMRVIPSYRKAMNPDQNPLKQRKGESTSNFQQRKLIQQRGHQLLEKIGSGQAVERDEINQFRDACYGCIIEGGKRVVDSRRGQADAAEALSRILGVLDFDGGTYQIVRNRIPTSVPYEVDGSRLNPTEYSSLENLKSEVEVSSPTVEVAAFNYMGSYVPLQRLIDETWVEEKIEAKYVEYNESGKPIFKKFDSMRLQKEINAEEFPEVIRVTVKQFEEEKATITQTNSVYPFGSGKGPKYRLEAIIEHRPGHYVAHTRGSNDHFIEANDSWVHSSTQTLGGFAYYYVKEE